MEDVLAGLKILEEEINLNLRVLDEKNNIVFDNLHYSESNISKKIKINREIYKIILDIENKNLFPFIEFTLNKLVSEENIIESLIEGKKSLDSSLEKLISKDNKIILLEVKNKKDIIEIVKDSYIDIEVYVGEVYDRIIILGNLEEEEEHALSIRYNVAENIGEKVKVSISYIKGSDIESFKNAYEEAMLALKIGSFFNIHPEIYNIKNMLLEKAIFNLSKEYLNELRFSYKDIFKNFNYELFQTLEEILACNLSLSKASKNLYIHRNTLMYRIDKIRKETGFDIRNFKEATFLYIIYINRSSSKRI